MISKLLFLFFSIIQNQEIQESFSQLAQTKKLHNLSQLITLLSITILTLIILLSINLFKNYKLSNKVRKLEKKLQP